MALQLQNHISLRCQSRFQGPIGSRLARGRNYAAKDVKFGVEARSLMLKSLPMLPK
ncbi:heat shock protein 60 [Actinidia rufa]|uniref:Heat shock protein 60 n=1 Tax=Actinidia rufa TaxID=165716 RepID=A0A7J0FLE0_9ERIC|nr:heat shock protein 60 [Actinidia rufa]